MALCATGIIILFKCWCCETSLLQSRCNICSEMSCLHKEETFCDGLNVAGLLALYCICYHRLSSLKHFYPSTMIYIIVVGINVIKKCPWNSSKSTSRCALLCCLRNSRRLAYGKEHVCVRTFIHPLLSTENHKDRSYEVFYIAKCMNFHVRAHCSEADI